jgi:DNA-binding NtrC family response regulator
MLLFVEDDSISRTAFAKILRAQGHEVIEAANGNEALELLDLHPINLVITDLVLGDDLNGLILITRIRRRSPHMPIVLMSGYISQNGGEHVLSAFGHRVQFFQKPVRPSALVATVQRLLPPMHS